MTHEYVIALGGRIHAPARLSGDAAPTALGWAASAILAVGTDDAVRSISRGDSTFLDLEGCVITAIPNDPEAAAVLVGGSMIAEPYADSLAALLVRAGLLAPDAILESGATADLAFWQNGPAPGASAREPGVHLVATVRGGAFTQGDARRGPFGAPPT